MRNLICMALLASVLLISFYPGAVHSKEATKMLENIKWLGHDTFLVTGDRTIYTDPFQIGSPGPVADIILITHEHRDHCSPDDVKRSQAPGRP